MQTVDTKAFHWRPQAFYQKHKIFQMQDSRVSSETSNFSFWRPQSFIKDPKLSSRRIDFQRRIQLFIGDRKHSQITASSHQNPKHFRGDTRFLNLGLKLFIGDPKLFIGSPQIFIEDPNPSFSSKTPNLFNKNRLVYPYILWMFITTTRFREKACFKDILFKLNNKNSNSMCVRKKVCYNHKQQFFW